ncbi:GNAT family N-acetyltransferase [Streptomyces sp. KK5PA1]|uniref:GNAT family N-acetyltransferase n=1 Tax=Actinacidiphila acididurans TaxID=2784346 RepID=A0ABS2TM78_9ACTN|nr:GNAT family N-acetyltransferase [Actinacidiphila acididurans]
MTAAGYALRPATRADAAELARLYADHARYEKAAPPHPDAVAALLDAAAGPAPRAWALVAQPPGARGAPGGQLAGYAAYSLEFAAWSVREYVHLDCLYLDAEHRGKGVGAALLDEVAAHAGRLGAPRVEWQTPDWNEGAVRFYRRYGARGLAKVRFSLPLPAPVPPADPAPGGSVSRTPTPPPGDQQ